MDYTQEIRGFLDEDGKIKSWPTKRRKKILCMLYLAQKMRPDYVYTEKEFNQLLNDWNTFGDFCLLRRDMYDFHIVNRNGESKYWLEQPQPTLATFGLE